MEFNKQYKSPKWQKKRLEILERDEYTCQSCGEDEKTLHVHHYFYMKDLMLWEYDEKYLVTFCDYCHDEWHKISNEIKFNLCIHPSFLLDTLNLLKITNQMNPYGVVQLTKIADILLNLKR